MNSDRGIKRLGMNGLTVIPHAVPDNVQQMQHNMTLRARTTRATCASECHSNESAAAGVELAAHSSVFGTALTKAARSLLNWNLSTKDRQTAHVLTDRYERFCACVSPRTWEGCVPHAYMQISLISFKRFVFARTARTAHWTSTNTTNQLQAFTDSVPLSVMF